MHATRRMWTLYEPIHAIVYFASERDAAYKAIGLRGGWMGYFGSRAAPMGPVGPEVVTATFHNFQPAMVARAIPDAWKFSDPERILRARHEIVDAALTRLFADAIGDPEVAEAAALATRAARAGEAAGRPLYAAHTGLPASEEPHLALWDACTLLREHRFDGHVASLTAEGIGGCEALVTATAYGKGATTAATLRSFRGWSEEEWSSAEKRLRDRGLLDADGSLTASGRSLREAVEARTDTLAAPPWDALTETETERLAGLLRPLVRRLAGPGGLVYPNPIGIMPPD